MIRRAWRKKRSPWGIPDKARTLRFLVCSGFIAAACGLFYFSLNGVLTGKILETWGSGFVSSNPVTVYRADDPEGFWKIVWWEAFGGLILLYLAAAEMLITVKRSRHAKSKPSA